MRQLLFLSIALLSLSFAAKKPTFTYIAIGDGYTKGLGVLPEERWTNLIEEKFENKKIKFELKGNLADSAYTIKTAIKNHIGDIQAAQANIVSIMLGAAEASQNMSNEEFEADYIKLLTLTLAQVPSHNSILLITIPDFTAVPLGKQLTRGFDAHQKIKDFNRIIMRLAKERNIRVYDIFQASDQLGKIDKLLAGNGIYPSKYGHQAWAKMLLPEFEHMITIPLDKDLKKKYKSH